MWLTSTTFFFSFLYLGIFYSPLYPQQQTWYLAQCGHLKIFFFHLTNEWLYTVLHTLKNFSYMWSHWHCPPTLREARQDSSLGGAPFSVSKHSFQSWDALWARGWSEDQSGPNKRLLVMLWFEEKTKGQKTGGAISGDGSTAGKV